MIGMYNVRMEPRMPMPHHLQNLPNKYRPGAKGSTKGKPPSTHYPVALFRWFEEEAQYSKLAALSRNPYHGEIMIDAESLEV